MHWMDAYFAARLAFVGWPGVRICTRPARHLHAGLEVHAVGYVPHAGLMELSYRIDALELEDRCACNYLASKALDYWETKASLCEPRGPFSLARVPLGARLVVRRAWGDELSMWVDAESGWQPVVYVSPAAYRELLYDKRMRTSAEMGLFQLDHREPMSFAHGRTSREIPVAS